MQRDVSMFRTEHCGGALSLLNIPRIGWEPLLRQVGTDPQGSSLTVQPSLGTTTNPNRCAAFSDRMEQSSPCGF